MPTFFFMLAILLFCNYESLWSVSKGPLFTSHLFLYMNEWVSSILCTICLTNIQWFSKSSEKCIDKSLDLICPCYFPLYLYTATIWTSTSLVWRHCSHTLESKISPLRPWWDWNQIPQFNFDTLLISPPTYSWDLISHSFVLYLLSIFVSVLGPLHCPCLLELSV